MAKLTLKQQRFADEYIKTGNATLSAITAGYSKKTAAMTGSENLRKPYIKKYIDDRLDELKKQSIAEQDEVLQYLTSVMRGETKEDTLIGVGEGCQSITKTKVTEKDRIKAAELLGKRHMLWTEKQEVSLSGSVQFVDDIE